MSRKILVTGATGIVGGAAAATLLQASGDDTLLFLVRAADQDAGLLRLRQSLGKFGLTPKTLNQLKAGQIICGDLAKAAAFLADSRLDQVTHVINCAAISSFTNHPGIWPVNVDGTFALAKRMSEVPGLKRFVHVGTAMACGPNQTSPVHESWDLPTDPEHLVQYTASKAEVERRMRTMLPTLPLVVARPSIVVGHSHLGCRQSGSIFWVFRMAHALEKFSCSLDDKIDIIPSDYCGQALVHLCLAKTLQWNLYHVSAGMVSSHTFREIDIALSAASGVPPMGPRFEQFAIDDIGSLAHDFQEKLGKCNRRLVAKALRLYGGFAELNYVFDNSRLLQEGMPQAPHFTSYIDKCVATSEHMPISEQMLEDFK
jgi:nucleoside-diphosphate-sugar epimerase